MSCLEQNPLKVDAAFIPTLLAPRYYLSNAPEDTPLETLAYVGGSRWRIETEFETEKSDVGLCLLGGAFLLSLQQTWRGKDAPGTVRAG